MQNVSIRLVFLINVDALRMSFSDGAYKFSYSFYSLCDTCGKQMDRVLRAVRVMREKKGGEWLTRLRKRSFLPSFLLAFKINQKHNSDKNNLRDFLHSSFFIQKKKKIRLQETVLYIMSN